MQKNKNIKNTWSLVIAAAAIISILFYVSTTGKKPPFIPADENHPVVTTQEACTTCHAPGRQAPLKETHPPKEQCLVCHKNKKP